MKEFESLKIIGSEENIGLNPDTIFIENTPELWKSKLGSSDSLSYGRILDIREGKYSKELFGIMLIVEKDLDNWTVYKSGFNIEVIYNKSSTTYEKDKLKRFRANGQSWQIFKGFKTRKDAIVVAKKILLDLPANMKLR